MAFKPATIVEAATMSTTTFEKPSPMPLKKVDTSFMAAFTSRRRMVSAMKASAKEKSVISTSPTFACLKKAQKKIVSPSGSTGKTAYHAGASALTWRSSDSSTAALIAPSVRSRCFCQK